MFQLMQLTSHLLSVTAVTHVGHPHAFSSLVAQPPCHVAEPIPIPIPAQEIAWALQDTILCLGRRSLVENSARDASACLCCRCFPFTQPNLTILLSTQLQASSRPINQPREGVSYCATASSLGRDTGGLMLHTHQQSFPVTQAEDSSLAGTSLLPRPASPFVVHGWRLLFHCATEKAKVWRPGLG